MSTEHVRLLDPLGVALGLAPRIFGDVGDDYVGIATWLIALACVGWTGSGAGAASAWRYRKLAAV